MKAAGSKASKKASPFAGTLARLSQFQESVARPGEVIQKIPLDQIDCVEQIRSEENPGFSVESLTELGNSMAAEGQHQAALLRSNPAQSGRYIMVAGERRLRAARLKGLPTLDAVVREMTDEEAERAQWSENIHRKALMQLEEANAVARSYKKLKTLEAVSADRNISVTRVSELLRFLKAGDIAQAAMEVSSDVSFINEVDRLAQKNPEAAIGVVEALRKDTTLNARTLVRKEIKKSKNAKPKSPKDGRPASAPNALDTLYIDLVESGLTPRAAIKKAGALRQDIEARLLDVWRDGKAAKKGGALAATVATRLKSGAFAVDGRGLLELVAFLDGAGGGAFDLIEVIGKARP